MPDVSSQGDSVIFALGMLGSSRIRAGTRLVLRCDNNGDVWARIVDANTSTDRS